MSSYNSHYMLILTEGSAGTVFGGNCVGGCAGDESAELNIPVIGEGACEACPEDP